MASLVKSLIKFIESLKGYQITVGQFVNPRLEINIKTRRFDDYC